MRFLLLAVLLILMSRGRAQDLIVTTGGDSIRCAITAVTANRLFYSVVDASEKQRRDIAMEDVAVYTREGFFPVVVSRIVPPAPTVKNEGRKRWLMSFSGGCSRRTYAVSGALPGEEQEHLKRLRNGINACASLHHTVGKRLALGLAYSSFFGSMSHTSVTFLTADSSATTTAELEENIRMRYLGVDLLWQPPSRGKWAFSGSLGMGYLGYSNYVTLVNKATISGWTLARKGQVGLDYSISSTTSVGACLGYVSAELDRVEIDLGATSVNVSTRVGKGESLDRFDVGLMLRVRL